MPDLTPLVNGGLAGVCIALIFLIAFIINRVFKLVGNHIAHATEAWNMNTKVLTKLEGKIDYDIKAQKETTNMMREVKEYLIKENGGK